VLRVAFVLRSTEIQPVSLDLFSPGVCRFTCLGGWCDVRTDGPRFVLRRCLALGLRGFVTWDAVCSLRYGSRRFRLPWPRLSGLHGVLTPSGLVVSGAVLLRAAMSCRVARCEPGRWIPLFPDSVDRRKALRLGILQITYSACGVLFVVAFSGRGSAVPALPVLNRGLWLLAQAPLARAAPVAGCAAASCSRASRSVRRRVWQVLPHPRLSRRWLPE